VVFVGRIFIIFTNRKEKKVKKLFLGIFVILIAVSLVGVFSLTSCKTEEAIEEAAEEAIEEAAEEVEEEAEEEAVEEEALTATLELWHWQPGENYKTALDEIIELFKAEHTLWTLDIFQTIGGGSGGQDYWTQFAAKALADEFPPLFGVLPGSNLHEYASKLVDITDEISADPEWSGWAERWTGNTEWQIDGRIYGVPIDKWDVGLWYWRDISESNGFEEPKTIEDLIALAQPVKDAGLIPIATGLQTIQQTTYLFANLVGQYGYPGLEQAEAGEIKWNNPDFLKCLTAINDVYDAGMYREDALQQGYTAMDLPDFQAKSAWSFWMGGDYFAGSIDAAEIGNVEIIPYPLVDDSGESCFISSVGQTFCMPANIDDTTKTVAMAFQKFLSSPKASEVFLKNAITPAGAIPEGFVFENPIIEQTIRKVSEVYEVNPYINDPEILNKLGELTTAMYLDQVTPEEVLNEIDDFMGTLQ